MLMRGRKVPKIIHNRSMITMMILALALLLSSGLTAAQDGELCSCSPRQYYFRLNLSNTCPPLPPPFPPNDFFGEGVRDYTCSIGPEPVSNRERDGADNVDAGALGSFLGRNLGKVSGTDSRLDENMGFDDNPPTDDFVTPQIVDPEPVVVDSIQFLEIDPSFNVINQDPSYVRDVEFVDGDVFNYTSISELIVDPKGTEANQIPGGIQMVLRGYNANGERVRNTFTITFTNECGVPTFKEGEGIGWVAFDSFEPASEETCRSVGGSLFPTPSGQTPAPTSGEEITSPTDDTPSPTPAQSKPDTVMSYDFEAIYSAFEPVPSSSAGDAVGYVGVHGKGSKSSGGKSSKSSNGKSYKSRAGGYESYGGSGKTSKSSSKSGKSSKSSGSKSSKSKRRYEPVRHLRAGLDAMDLDRGAKPSKYLR